MARRDTIFKKTIRILNLLILISFVLVFLAVIMEKVIFQINSLFVFVIPAIWLFNYYVKLSIKESCQFYIADKNEREKSKEFNITVNFIVTFLISTASFILIITISEFIENRKYFLNIKDLDLEMGIKTGLFYVLILCLNAFYTITLHLPIYYDFLTLDVPDIEHNLNKGFSEDNIKEILRYSSGRFLKL